MLRCYKNRFGSTHEVGVFAMTESGLVSMTVADANGGGGGGGGSGGGVSQQVRWSSIPRPPPAMLCGLCVTDSQRATCLR